MDDVQDRGEGLRLHDRPVILRTDDGGLDEVTTGFRQRLAAREELAAGRLGRREGRLIALDGARVDQRAHERAVLERVADLHLRVGMDEPTFQLRRA